MAEEDDHDPDHTDHAGSRHQPGAAWRGGRGGRGWGCEGWAGVVGEGRCEGRCGMP
jgi:hypothetical protein